jgi:hypothetical protein
MRPPVGVFVLALLAAGCEGEVWSSGASEPVRVQGGTFVPGALPVDDSAEIPLVVSAAGASYVVTQGKGNVRFRGLATPDAYTVAVSAMDINSGYWVVPLDGPDATQDNDLIISMTLDFLPEVPYGLQTLSFVAIDENGHPGPRYDSPICVLPDYAEGSLAACSDEITPANAVVSLSWDTNVDLDLVVITPSGKVVDWDAPTTGAVDGDSVPRDIVRDETTGQLSRDSNANCVIDGIRLESLIFPGEPPAGDYQVYADLNAACGESYVNFSLDQYRRTDADDGTHPVEKTALGTGELVAEQQDGGASLGTYLTTVTLP